MSLTLNLSIKDLDSKVLEWYSKSSLEEVSEALWYGWKSVVFNQSNNLQTNKKIDELKDKINDIEKENQLKIDKLEREKQTIIISKNKIEQECNLLNNTYSRTINNLVDSGVEEKTKWMEEKTRYMNYTIDELNDKIIKLEQVNSQKNEELIEIREIFNNSKKKGDYAEEKINEYLEKEFKSDYIIYQPGLEGQKHQGDIHILLKDQNLDNEKPYLGKSRIMIESKFYKNTHKYSVSYELEKFYGDIDYCLKHKMPIHSAVFISLDCSIHDKTESYCYEEYQGIRIHFIANMTRDKWILLKSLIEIETYMHNELNVNNDKTQKIYTIMEEGFSNIYNSYNNLYNLEPKFDKIVDFVKVQQRDYDKNKKKINNSVEMLMNRMKQMIDGFKINNIDYSELEVKILEKGDINDVSKNDFLTFQELYKQRMIDSKKLESKLLELQEQIKENKIKEEINNQKKVELKCPYCPKTYSKKRYYDEHVAKCKKKNTSAH